MGPFLTISLSRSGRIGKLWVPSLRNTHWKRPEGAAFPPWCPTLELHPSGDPVGPDLAGLSQGLENLVFVPGPGPWVELEPASQRC